MKWKKIILKQVFNASSAFFAADLIGLFATGSVLISIGFLKHFVVLNHFIELPRFITIYFSVLVELRWGKDVNKDEVSMYIKIYEYRSSLRKLFRKLRISFTNKNIRITDTIFIGPVEIFQHSCWTVVTRKFA